MSEIEEMNPMQCIEFEEIVHDLDRPGAHGVALRERALIHAESCARCARLLLETESLDQALRAIAATEGEQEAPAWLESALLREFRDAKAGAARSNLGRHVAAFGIAATVLLAAGVSLFHFQPGVKAPVAGPNDQPNVSVAATAGQNARGAENASGFIALPYADDPDGVEGGAVVRVRLSGPALASLGMPVSLTGSPATVWADLLVSDDGTPQAIRLLSQEEAGQDF